jgi:hypothetical protein
MNKGNWSGSRNSYSLYYQNVGSTLRFEVDSGAATQNILLSQTLTPLNAWTHLAMTWDGKVITAYVNGLQKATSSMSGNPNTSGSGLFFGSDAGIGHYFQGYEDDARVYNRTLSASDMTQLSQAAYRRYFYLTDVYRDGSGNIVTSGGNYDPSSKQVTVGYGWPKGATSTLSSILTRNENFVFDQTDWSGGSGANGPVTTTNNTFATSTNVSYTTTTGSFYLNVTGY